MKKVEAWFARYCQVNSYLATAPTNVQSKTIPKFKDYGWKYAKQKTSVPYQFFNKGFNIYVFRNDRPIRQNKSRNAGDT